MKKNKIYYSFIISALLLFISCGKNSNSVTNPVSEKTLYYSTAPLLINNEYRPNGIDSKYNGIWSFLTQIIEEIKLSMSLLKMEVLAD